MKISIITTCFNREKTIAQSIESMLSQDYTNKEYVVIDGGSRDGSVELIKKYEASIDTFISEPDTGMYNALNKGIKNCTGVIVGILHSDDFFYDNNTLSKIAKVFRDTNADIVYANGQYVDANDISKVRRIYPAKAFSKIYLYFGWIPLHTTIFAKREIFEKYGLYKENYQIASDYEISLRWFTNTQIKKVFLNQWVVKMRLGGKSTTMQQQKIKSTEDLEIIKQYQLLGKVTLFFKIARKIPQYILPRIIQYK